MSTKKIAGLSVLAAISIALVSIFHIPIFKAVPFLEYDMADVPLFIAGFLYGPVSGLALTLLVCVIQGVTVSAQSSFYGIIMHFIATGSFVLVSSIIYKYKRNIKGAIIAMLVGAVVWIVSMIFANLIVTPIFTGLPRQTIVKLFVYIIPFNVIKVFANSFITFLLYKRTSMIFHKYFESEKENDKKTIIENEIVDLES